jgi:hypothetical protein
MHACTPGQDYMTPGAAQTVGVIADTVRFEGKPVAAGNGDRLPDGWVCRAAFGPSKPMAAIAIVRSIDDARRPLADMLIFCDPGASLHITTSHQSETLHGFRGLPHASPLMGGGDR